MGKVVDLKESKKYKEQLFYTWGFVHAHFQEVDALEVFKLLEKAFRIGEFDYKWFQECTSYWPIWEEFKSTIEGQIKYKEEQEAKWKNE